MYPALCKVQCWVGSQIRIDNCLIYADSFADAAQKIEEYYGEDIKSLSIHMYDVGIWCVDDATTAHIVGDLS